MISRGKCIYLEKKNKFITSISFIFLLLFYHMIVIWSYMYIYSLNLNRFLQNFLNFSEFGALFVLIPFAFGSILLGGICAPDFPGDSCTPLQMWGGLALYIIILAFISFISSCLLSRIYVAFNGRIKWLKNL